MRRAAAVARVVLFPGLGVAALLLAERVFEHVDRAAWRRFGAGLGPEAREFLAGLRREWGWG